MPANLTHALTALLLCAVATAATAQSPDPSKGPAVWDPAVAGRAFRERAHSFLTSLAASRVLTQACTLPPEVLATQRALEAAYAQGLLELNLATQTEITGWETPAQALSSMTVNPETCALFADRMRAARPQYQNTLEDIRALRAALARHAP